MIKSAVKPILSVFVVLCTIACNTKEELPQGEDNLFFVEFTIDAATIMYEDGVDNYGNGPGIRSYPDSAGRLHSQFTTFLKSALDSSYESNILTIQMVKFFTDSGVVSYNTSFLMFDEGSYNYGSWSEDSTYFGVNGAVLTYTDSNEKIWSSDKRFGQQPSGNTFTITNHKAAGEEEFGAKTKGTFNCRLFDGHGEYLDLTNGSFHARTIYQQ